MGSNLLKGGYVVIKGNDKLVIDNNELIRKRLEELQVNKEECKEEEPQGFVEGIDPFQIERLVSDIDEISEEESLETISQGEENFDSTEAQQAQLASITNEEANEIIENAKKEAEEIKKAAYEEGFSKGQKAGYEEGKSALAMELDSHRALLDNEYASKARALEEEFSNMQRELEPDMVDKLSMIIKHVIGIKLEDERDIIIGILDRVLSGQNSSGRYLIHISKADFEMVSEKLPLLSKNAGIAIENLELIEDHTIATGGCLLETEAGIFDCGVDTQLELLTKQLKIISYNN